MSEAPSSLTPTEIVAKLVRSGCGILAADESVATCTSRLDKLGIASDEESRRAWREVLLAAPQLPAHVGGVILFDETLRQSASDGTPFVDVLAAAGVLAGIKVDTGAKRLAGSDGETITEGLDGLRERLAEYVAIGARFAKWRAVLRISAQTPSQNAMRANAHALARYAALCQEGGLAPIVEPEVLMEGTHDLDRCGAVTRATLEIVFEELALAGVDLAGIVLKPSMVVPGADGPGASVSEVADATVACLVAAVPATVGGIAFLSGGQSPASATAHLAAINERGPHPWPVTFSFGRAIQDDVLKVWMGSPENVESARSILAERLVANGEAARYELVDA